MKSHTTRETLSRALAVAKLRALADDIESGELRTPYFVARVADEVRLKLQIENNEVEFDMRW